MRTSEPLNGVTTQLQVISWTTGMVTILIISKSVAAGLVGYVVKGATVQPASASPHAATTVQAHAPGGNSGPTADNATTTVQVHTLGGNSGPPAHNMDPITLFLHFQSISTSGLLSLKYPPIYQAFTVNFAWANFILPLSVFRNAAKRMRKCDLDTHASGNAGLSQVSIPPVSSKASTGIPAYAAKLGVSPQDIFGIAYFVFLCACAALLVIFVFIGLAVQIASLMASEPERKEVWLERRKRWQQMSSNNSLRIITLALGTLTTFIFYQLTQKCLSSVTIFACASALILTIGPLAFVIFLIARLASKPDGIQHLFTKDSTYARRWGSLYDVLDHNRILFVIPLLALVVMRSAVVGFGQHSGMAQTIMIITLELITCTALFKYHPYYSPGYNRVNYMLSGTRAFSHILLLTFVDEFNINLVAKTALGIVLLIVNSVVALVLVVLTVLRLGWGVLWFRKKHVALESEKQRGKQPIRHSGYSYHDLENS